MPRSTVDPKIKAAAIADLQAGDQPAIVAERYGINNNTVKQWKSRYVTEVVTDVPDRVTVQKPALERQKTQLGEIILDLLAAKLEASKAIAEAARDPAWLRKQSATELATLGAYLDSTAFAIGDRLARSANPSTDGESVS